MMDKNGASIKFVDAFRLVNTNDKGRGIITNRHIQKEQVLFPFGGRLVSKGHVKNFNAALQIDENLFMESTGTIDENLNHSCEGNCRIDFHRWELVAARDIKAEEELTFNYHTTEYDLVEQGCAFLCSCNSPHCVGDIKGFRYLSSDCKRRLAGSLSPFLERKLVEETQSLALSKTQIETPILRGQSLYI